MSAEQLFILSLMLIWIMLLYHVVLAIAGYQYEKKLLLIERESQLPENPPFVSVLVPAHNEEKVIERTVRALCSFHYPKDRYEVIVINDRSTDRTGEILDRLTMEFPLLRPLHVQKQEKGGGKSAALNRGLQSAYGEVIAVYDADNTPEPSALPRLIATLCHNSEYGAVIGKFRVVNAQKNLLTRFIHIETISFQWMVQAGRWLLFKISSIPGTNFVIWRDVLEAAGTWDEQALAEDTELSIRIYETGRSICFMPTAITWEQEPETWKVWIRQRTRWVRGNSYVVLKFMRQLLKMKRKRMILDIIYFFFTYFLFLMGVMISDILFVLGIFHLVKLNLMGPYILIWLLAYILYILEIVVTLEIERTELTWTNIWTVCLMYFTYSQIWIYLVIKGLFLQIKGSILKEKANWYKTERF